MVHVQYNLASLIHSSVVGGSLEENQVRTIHALYLTKFLLHSDQGNGENQGLPASPLGGCKSFPVAIPALAWLPWYREIGPLSDLLSSPPIGSTPVEARPCVASSWGQLRTAMGLPGQRVSYSGLHDVQDRDPSSCKHSTSQYRSQPCGCPRKQIIPISWRRTVRQK